MYLEGMGFRAIGRVLKISYGTIYHWIKKWGNEANLPAFTEDKSRIEMIEIDEIHTYIQPKNYCWVWISVDRQAKRFISFVCGDRSTQTGLKLWEQIKGLKQKDTLLIIGKATQNFYQLTNIYKLRQKLILWKDIIDLFRN